MRAAAPCGRARTRPWGSALVAVLGQLAKRDRVVDGSPMTVYSKRCSAPATHGPTETSTPTYADGVWRTDETSWLIKIPGSRLLRAKPGLAQEVSQRWRSVAVGAAAWQDALDEDEPLAGVTGEAHAMLADP